MEISGNIAVPAPSNLRVLQQLSVAVLKQTQDVQAAVALELIASLPPPSAALSSGGSGGLDVYA